MVKRSKRKSAKKAGGKRAFKSGFGNFGTRARLNATLKPSRRDAKANPFLGIPDSKEVKRSVKQFVTA